MTRNYSRAGCRAAEVVGDASHSRAGRRASEVVGDASADVVVDGNGSGFVDGGPVGHYVATYTNLLVASLCVHGLISRKIIFSERKTGTEGSGLQEMEQQP